MGKIATPVTVLRSGGEYEPRHVQWLSRQVPGLVCLSDVEIKGVPTVRLKHPWPKWWPKMELWSDLIDGDLLHIDLDTVVLAPICEFLTIGRTTTLADFYRPALMGSGLMYIAQKDKPAIWSAFLENPALHMRMHRGFPLIGDQGFLHGRLKADRWQNVLPGKVASFKVHCQADVPHGVKVVCFHGQPRPWGIRRDWIPPLISC